MALKKSELYSSLWASCDELRGGMDASQYKDYVLVLLFVKYVSDRYAGQPFAAITVPEGSSFSDMVALKGSANIGDDINKKILGPLAQANKLSDMPDFNDPGKLGSGKEMVEKLTNLIAIFENPALDFSQNRADGDDLLGDAYEYLMRHFATESGKSKGQFYTPAEVSRVIAQILDIRNANTTASTTVYDPTCGSGSLLLKVGFDAAHSRDVKVTLFGQEMDTSTANLARMNMILHDYPTAVIEQGNTIANPLFRDGDGLKTFDYVVANPPFSEKRWSTGIDPENDQFQRFVDFGIPPLKQGDYAFFLHILRSIKQSGSGACILPHGVLFRGNAEAAIRRNIIQRGYIKAIIGLPANLFYGTGIPACILVLDKKQAATRQGVFMIDASKGFIKDGNKNRLREQDIHRIVDTFSRQLEVQGYSRMVPVSEISDAKNDYNLNLPRYIDSSDAEDLQDLTAHLRGGIPERDIDAFDDYWQVMPSLRSALFESTAHAGYAQLRVPISSVKSAIFDHPEFSAFNNTATKLFDTWVAKAKPELMAFDQDGKPKVLIGVISELLLDCFAYAKLLNVYDIYQHLMDYWAESMQDDCYLISADGWEAEPVRVISVNKKGKQVDKGWICELVPKDLVVNRYFQTQKIEIEQLTSKLEQLSASLDELEEENSSEGGVLSDVSTAVDIKEAWEAALLIYWSAIDANTYNLYNQSIIEQENASQDVERLSSNPIIKSISGGKSKPAQGIITKRLKETDDVEEQKILNDTLKAIIALKEHKNKAGVLITRVNDEVIKTLEHGSVTDDLSDLEVLQKYTKLIDEISELKSIVRNAENKLDDDAFAKYAQLTKEDVIALVVDDKWIAVLNTAVQGELDRVSQTLTGRIRELAERYEKPLHSLIAEVSELSNRVDEHLKKMVSSWK